jgi:hypothetical protein
MEQIMGEVVNIFGPRPDQNISFEEFSVAVQSPKSLTRVAKLLTRYCQLEKPFQLQPPEAIFRPREDIAYGTLLVPAKGTLATHQGFPQSLWEEDPTLGRKRALELAADTTNAYRVAERSLATRLQYGTLSRRAYGDDINLRLWNADSQLLPHAMLAYRAAGAVALSTQNIPGINMSTDHAYPPHIAGLLNPLPQAEVANVFSSLVSTTFKM